ncbi:unnamed protein product [Symbiodinium sp. CCMP2592]|nr:unnamed protein product [Symbiodinium sp. CCMP2592]CAE7839838.1 unnamed protein product [Symbiodinium sp. CCMP2592]
MNATFCNQPARDLLLTVVAWSFNCLSKGVYPHCDAFGKEFGPTYMPERAKVAGQRICGPYVCIFDGFQADWEYHKLALGLNRFYNKKLTCHLCSALQWVNAAAKPGEPNNVELLYSCFGHHAQHRSTLITTNEDFVEVHGESPLTRIDGFGPCRILPDYMHMVHLACAVDFLASMLLEVTDDATIVEGSSREKRLDLIWKDYRSWSEASQVGDRASRRMFTTAVLRNNKVVEVSQKILSATACRYMLLWAATFLTTVCESMSALPPTLKQPDTYMQVLTGLSCILARDVSLHAPRHLWDVAAAFRDMEMLMIHNGHSISTGCKRISIANENLTEHPRRFFDQASADQYEQAYLVLRFGFNELAASAISRGLPRYHFRPKLHLLEHAVLDFRPRNPRYFSNYLGEDAIRRIKALACKAPVRNMSHNVLLRYTVQMGLQWRREA